MSTGPAPIGLKTIKFGSFANLAAANSSLDKPLAAVILFREEVEDWAKQTPNKDYYCGSTFSYIHKSF